MSQTPITDAAKTGTPRDVLVAMRDRIALAVDDDTTPARDLASLTKRLMEVAREIEAIDKAAEEEGAHVVVPDEPFDPSAI